jgi:SAM-dependent methyltransferase
MKSKKGSDGQGVEQTLEQAVARETAVHGRRWAGQYSGYFSDPAVAAPFLDIIEESLREKSPDVLVDLGGGTGFILRELIRRGKIPDGLKLYDMDLSRPQLESLADARIRPLQSSFLEFQRAAVAVGPERLMLITRSTLHYAGIMGQKPVLRHIRDQLKPGEIFIHQTGCSASPEEALLVDELLERMHSDKWMPPLDSLVKLCEDAGFRVTRVADVPDLALDEPTLADRYGIKPEEMADIRVKLQDAYKDSPRWRITPEGFVILQAYKIMVCEAA